MPSLKISFPSLTSCDRCGFVIFILSPSPQGWSGGEPGLGRGIHFHFLERDIIFRTYKSSSNYQQRICTKKYLNEPIKPLLPVLREVRYRKIAIVELSCDITLSITLNLYNRVSFSMQILFKMGSKFSSFCHKLTSR